MRALEFPPNYITKPNTLTFKEVIAHPNAEVRYAGVKIFGLDKILSGEGASAAAKPIIVDTDKKSYM